MVVGKPLLVYVTRQWGEAPLRGGRLQRVYFGITVVVSNPCGVGAAWRTSKTSHRRCRRRIFRKPWAWTS